MSDNPLVSLGVYLSLPQISPRWGFVFWQYVFLHRSRPFGAEDPTIQGTTKIRVICVIRDNPRFRRASVRLGNLTSKRDK